MTSKFKCEWDNCRDTFQTPQNLQDHLFKHLLETEPESAQVDASKQLIKATDKTKTEIFDKATMVISSPAGKPLKGIAVGSSRKPAGNIDDDIKCSLCLSGNYGKLNHIVLCDKCDRGYHQNCHQPNIPHELIADTKSKWFCCRCA